jgi:putative ATP-dependent endonuclease of OLD family
VREAVMAFPELYFSRLVILGEGDSEEVVLPRILRAKGFQEDEASIAIVPLGGRHVNHFWRLLHGLGIAYVTLLDLDLGRFQGGWGRIRYALRQQQRFPQSKNAFTQKELDDIPKWDDKTELIKSDQGKQWIKRLEKMGVFFSSPLDLDFSMMCQFPTAYDVPEETKLPSEKTVSSVLGKNHGDVSQYLPELRRLFYTYQKRFKLSSKPAAHVSALSKLSDEELLKSAPVALDRLIKRVANELAEIPE